MNCFMNGQANDDILTSVIVMISYTFWQNQSEKTQQIAITTGRSGDVPYVASENDQYGLRTYTYQVHDEFIVHALYIHVY